MKTKSIFLFAFLSLFCFNAFAGVPVLRGSSEVNDTTVEVVSADASNVAVTSPSTVVASAVDWFGFGLGLLLGLIGVILAHIFSNDRTFRKSSWYGFGVLLIILLVGL
jgi:hypothetical protein